MSVNLTDVAEALGVSTATVSLALNGSDLVNLETRKRVTEMADKLGYIPNSIARGLARKKSGSLGLIIPDIENVYYSELVKHIDNFSKQAGYRLFIMISNNNPKEEEETVSVMIANQVEGVIIVPVNMPNQNTDYFKKLQSNNIPFVFSSSMYHGFNAPYVMCDLEEGMYQLTVHLVKKNKHRNYLYLTGPEDVTSLIPREKGFLRALRETDNINFEIIRVNSVDYDSACEAIEAHLQGEQLADVIMCVNDTMAIGVINILARNGISVPGDVSVTGFDNSLFAEVSVVKLTSVLQDIESIAKHSTEILIKSINKEEAFETEILIPTQIIKRASTADIS